MRKILTAAVLCTVVAAWALAAEWPGYLGPDRNGVSPETGLARSWATPPKELWSLPVGAGFSGAAIEGGKVYLLDRQGGAEDTKDVLRCLDLASGKEDWTFAYDAPGKFDYNGSRTAPTVDAERVYVVGPMGQFHCVDKTTHQALWKVHLLEDFGSKLPKWAVAMAPLLYKDWVVLAPQARDVGLVAYDKKTGKEAWRSATVGRMSYSSPVLATIGGVDQFVMVSSDRVAGVDASNGTVLWTYSDWKCGIPIPPPTVIGDGRLFITGGYDAGCAMFKVAKTDEGWTAQTLYKNKNIRAHLHPAILYKGFLYANANQGGKGAGLVCMDLDGTVKWQTDNTPNIDMGGLLIADGLVYVMGAGGALKMAEASPEAYKELGSATVLGGPQIWAPLALGEGKLVVRDQKQLKCLDVKAPAAAR